MGCRLAGSVAIPVPRPPDSVFSIGTCGNRPADDHHSMHIEVQTMVDTRNSRVGQKLVSLWLRREDFNVLKEHCEKLGVDRSTFLKLAAFSLMERKKA